MPFVVTRVLAAAIALLVIAVAPSTEPESKEKGLEPPQEAVMQASSARAFGDSVGVNVHLTYVDTAYRDFDTVSARLQELGVRYIRDGLCATCPFQLAHLNTLAAAGIRANLIVGDLKGGAAKMRESLSAIGARLRPAVASIEAPNEPDKEGVPGWLERTRAYQADLYAAVKADPGLAELPVLGPSLTQPDSWAAMGDLSPHLDRGNFHPYPGGGKPLHNIERERELATRVSGSKPLVITEIGYHSDVTTDGGHLPASERAIGAYTPRLALESYRAGVERAYLYQLADQWSDGEAKAREFPGFENRFGLLRADLSPKPSFLSLRNLLRSVGAGAPAVREPGQLSVGLDGAPSDLRRLLLHSGDGTYALVLWRDVSLWDVPRRRDLEPGPATFDVVMGQRVELARRFDPVRSDAESRRWRRPRRVPVDLGGEPVVLKLTPG